MKSVPSAPRTNSHGGRLRRAHTHLGCFQKAVIGLAVRGDGEEPRSVVQDGEHSLPCGEPGTSASFTFSLTIPASTVFSNTWPTYCTRKTEALVPDTLCGASANTQPVSLTEPTVLHQRDHSGGSSLKGVSVSRSWAPAKALFSALGGRVGNGACSSWCLFSACSKGAGTLMPCLPGSSRSGPGVSRDECVSPWPSAAAPGSVPRLQPPSLAISAAGPGAEQEVGPGVASPACPLPFPVKSLLTQSPQGASVSVLSGPWDS